MPKLNTIVLFKDGCVLVRTIEVADVNEGLLK
jgi:hypothetical protein